MVTGRDVPEDQFAVRFDNGLWAIDPDGLLRATEAAERQRHSERTSQILAFVRGRDESRPSDVAHHLSCDPKRASEVLSRLAARGLIRKLHRGAYGRAESAESAENPVREASQSPHSMPTAEIRIPVDTGDPQIPQVPQATGASPKPIGVCGRFRYRGDGRVNRRITENILGGENPGDMVDIIAQDFGVAVSVDEVFIIVDGGGVGLLRIRSHPGFALDLMLLLAKGICEQGWLCSVKLRDCLICGRGCPTSPTSG
jgi:hypothetical protein